MKRIERSESRRLEERSSGADGLAGFDHGDLSDDSLRLLNQFRYGAPNGAHDLDLDNRARQLVLIALEQLT